MHYLGMCGTLLIMATHRIRVPKLTYSDNRGIGWHVSYRDPDSGTPRKHKFGKVPEARAKVAYAAWLSSHLKHRAGVDGVRQVHQEPAPIDRQPHADPLLVVATGLLNHEESRTRGYADARRPGTLHPEVYPAREHFIHEFLAHLNSRHGTGAVSWMRLAHLMMEDVESYNRAVAATYSQSQTDKRMQAVRALILQAGRPEHGQQVLGWQWESLRRVRGRPTQVRRFPTLTELRKLIAASDLRGQTWIWMGLGCGFGAMDLSTLRVGQMDREGYDLRRGKTGVDRWGTTPAQVWVYVDAFIRESSRPPGELTFITRHGHPLLHGRTDAVALWWQRLRKSAGVTVGGFYVLRHIGATEFGSRPGCSIGAMRQWLGHSASSRVADLYMRPVSPEQRELIEWLRARLVSGPA